VSVPVGEELLEADVGQRMLNQLLIDTIGHGTYVSPGQRRFNDMHRVPYTCDQNFGFEIVVVVDRDDLPNEFHPVGADIIEASNKWRDAPGARFRCQQRLGRRETQRHVDANAFSREPFRGFEPFRNQRALDHDVLMELG